MRKAKQKVVIFALIKKTQILIETRPVKGFSTHQVLIPGGTVKDWLLEGYDEALKREMMEELGVKPLQYDLLTKEEIPGINNNLLIPFIVETWEGVIPEINFDLKDPYPLSWMEIDEVLEVPVKPTREIAKHLKRYLSKK